MGQLLLVRHAQASFGAANYDELSALGQRQAVRLGEHLRAHLHEAERGFDAVLTGTLVRHAQTLAGLAQGLGQSLHALQTPQLNEYDSAALIHAIHPEPLPPANTPELYKHHFRLLRDGLRAWMDGVTSPIGMPSYAEVEGGVRDVLQRIRSEHSHARVLVVSSGGPISTAVGQVLSTPPEVTIDLNFRIRNTAVNEFVITPRRLQLLTFNTLPHLDGPDYRDWITSA